MIIGYVLMVLSGVFLMVRADGIVQRTKEDQNGKKIFQQLYIKEKVTREERQYKKKKIIMVGGVLCAAGILGMVYIILTSGSEKVITGIKRPSHGAGTQSYQLLARQKESGEKIDIGLQIKEKAYSQEEKRKICEEALEQWLPLFLGNNRGLDDITDNLNLIREIKEFPVQFDYVLDAQGYIQYDGSINFAEIPYEDETYRMDLSVLCIMEDYQCQRVIEITIRKPEQPELSLQERVQQMIDSQNKEEVELPDKVDGKEIEYIQKESTYTWIFLPGGIILAIFVYYCKDQDLKKQLKKRTIQIQSDYSEIVSMISMLQGTGQSIRKSWAKVIEFYEGGDKVRYAYEEMKLAKNKMENGISEIQAYREFGRRCGTYEYIKLANILEQNISKGSNAMRLQLMEEVNEAAQNKICLAKKTAEECSTKLLIPMVLMLIVVMTILMVPAFLSMNIQ